MKTSDFNSPLTSAKLNENMNKMFGVNVKLENYSREQLEDMRNKLRTRVFQQEGSAGINDLLTNETYQKDKAMLDLLNTRIKEMLGENIKQLRDKMMELSEGKRKDLTGDGKKDFDDVQVARMTAGGVPKKKAIAKATSDKVKEGFPTVDTAKAAHAEREKAKGTGKFDKKTTTTGTAYTRKSNTFDNGTEDKPKDKKVKEGTKHPKSCTCDECNGMWEGKADELSTRPGMFRSKADMDNRTTNTGKPTSGEKRIQGYLKHTMKNTQKQGGLSGPRGVLPEQDMAEGKDEGKPGKNFKKIAKDAGQRYGSKEAGERVAGAVRAKLAKQGKLEESNFKNNVRFVNESLQFLLAEDEEAKAKAITSAGDMVNDFTSWMQRVGQYQTKTMIELADAIKADFGAEQAEAFKASVGPALSATLETLTQQREAVSNAVAVLAGEATPEAPMGMEPEMPAEPDMDMSAPDEMNPEPAGDEFGAADAAAGAGTTGREMRESKFARKLAESHNIMASLAK